MQCLIRYLKNNDINQKKWDACIYHSVNSLPYAYSWYLNTVSPDWDALVLGDYEMVMPLPYRKKLHIQYIFQPFFVQQLGVFSIHPLSHQLVKAFLNSIPPHFKWMDSFLNEGNQFPLQQFNTSSRINYVLALNKPYNTLQNNYNNNTKRNLKKCCTAYWDKFPISVQHSVAPEELVQLYKDYVGKKLSHLQQREYQQLQRIIYQAIQHNMAEIRGVYDEFNQLCAAAFFIKTKNRIINLLPVSNDIGKNYRAMFFIIDQIIKEYADTHYLLDFEGSMIPSIAQFYKGFGAKPVQYWHIQKNELPWYIKWMKKSE